MYFETRTCRTDWHDGSVPLDELGAPRGAGDYSLSISDATFTLTQARRHVCAALRAAPLAHA